MTLFRKYGGIWPAEVMRRVIEIVNNECPQLIDDRKMTSCGPFNRSRATIGARNARPTVGQRDLFDRVSIRNFHRETAIVPKCTSIFTRFSSFVLSINASIIIIIIISRANIQIYPERRYILYSFNELKKIFRMYFRKTQIYLDLKK